MKRVATIFDVGIADDGFPRPVGTVVSIGHVDVIEHAADRDKAMTPRRLRGECLLASGPGARAFLLGGPRD